MSAVGGPQNQQNSRRQLGVASLRYLPIVSQSSNAGSFGFSTSKIVEETFDTPKEVTTCEEDNNKPGPWYIFILMLCCGTCLKRIPLLCHPIVSLSADTCFFASGMSKMGGGGGVHEPNAKKNRSLLAIVEIHECKVFPCLGTQGRGWGGPRWSN